MRATKIILIIVAIVIASCGRQVHHKALVTDVRYEYRGEIRFDKFESATELKVGDTVDFVKRERNDD